MALLKYNNVGVKAVAACVPKNIEKISQLDSLFSEKEKENFIATTGIKERRIVSTSSVCSSDLCYTAAERLLSENNIDRNSIDMLLFMTQEFDYITPATSPILQYRLGLSEKVACMDMSLACSGYVYAISTAMAFCNNPGVNRVLVLVGDVSSRNVDRNDSSFWPLIGDAGTATLVEKGSYDNFYFDLVTFGNSYKSILIPGSLNGRNPVNFSGFDSTITKVKLDGLDVFSFAINHVPKSIKRIMEFSGDTITMIDKFLLHQANGAITKQITKKLNLSSGNVPSNIDVFGNTSMASIPLLMVTELRGCKDRKWLLSGFGAGLSIGTCIGSFENCNISELIELA